MIKEIYVMLARQIMDIIRENNTDINGNPPEKLPIKNLNQIASGLCVIGEKYPLLLNDITIRLIANSNVEEVYKHIEEKYTKKLQKAIDNLIEKWIF